MGGKKIHHKKSARKCRERVLTYIFALFHRRVPERHTPASVAPLSSSSVYFLNFRARSLSLSRRKKEMGGGGFYGGKGPTKRSASSSSMGTTKTPLEIAREEDALEAELGYHVPPADEGEQKLGWLVNASAVRFRRFLRRRLSFCALGNFGIIARERERRDWKNSKITSISLRARARDVVSLSFSTRSPRPSKTTR